MNMKVFTVTFDQFNAFLLNKSMNFFKKNYLSPNLWTVTSGEKKDYFDNDLFS